MFTVDNMGVSCVTWYWTCLTWRHSNMTCLMSAYIHTCCHTRTACEPINTEKTVIGLKLSPSSLITLAILIPSQLTSKLNGVNSNCVIFETCVLIVKSAQYFCVKYSDLIIWRQWASEAFSEESSKMQVAAARIAGNVLQIASCSS